MKKAWTVACAAAVLAASVPMFSMTAGAEAAVYAKPTSYLNVRSGAGMGYSVVRVISSDDSVTILDHSNTDWLKVKLSDGKTGYCSANYLDITTKARTTEYLNMRSGAGTNYSVKQVLAPNTELTIIRFYGKNWAQIRTSGGATGYVCTDYLSYEDSSKNNTVKISDSSKVIRVGETVKLTATASSGGKITWSSSNTQIAYTTSTGYVTAVRAGTANTIAKDAATGVQSVCTVTVFKSSVESIKFDVSSKTLKIGDSFQIKATVTPANSKVVWKSSNTSVAKVENGKVTAVGDGNAEITCSDSTGYIYAKCKVTVYQKETITLNQSSVTVTAGSSCKLTANKANPSTVIKWSSSNLSVASVTNGIVSGLSAGTATITASDSTGKIKATCKVTVNKQTNNGSVSLSHIAATTTAGKTVYIKGYSSSKAYWGSSDENVADVYDGFIRTKNPGKAAITYKDSKGNCAICVVTVNDAAPIRFAYSSPNSATLNSNVALVAITDKSRSKVKFEVTVNGKVITVNASEKTVDGNTYVWKGYYKPTQAGTFGVKAYSYSDGLWKTCSDGQTDIYVSNKTNASETGLSQLRASDGMIKFVGEKEGFVSYVTYDTIANNLPTLGHGYVVWPGQCFYNGLTKNEGYALLVDAVNNDSYTSKVNSMLINNNIRFNQQQFDALVSFSYNLGTGWTSSSDLKNILLNSYGTVTNGTAMTGTVTSADGLNLRWWPTTTSTPKALLKKGEKVTLVSNTKYNGVWYQVKTASGMTGYCSGTYLNLEAKGTVGRDLKYVNKNALINEMLSYHHSMGVCYYGLLYRRADELEMFLYGDYTSDGRNNKYHFPNPSCISFP